MKVELQNKLVTKYSKFFEYLKDYDGPMIPMSFGIECNDGWYFILDSLMNNIQNYIKWNNKKNINVTQIKEKFGALCFYYDNGDEYIDGMISLATSISLRTCEFCGATHNVGHTTGGVYTICKECFDSDKVNVSEWKPIE